MSVFSLPSFNNSDLWQQAMTHSSFANEHPEDGAHNERLEFLGDAILTFLSGVYLYQRYPNRPEGDLTPARAALVDQAQLCHFAEALELGKHLRLGRGAAMDDSSQNARLLCSAFEALVGAYYLDSGSNIQKVSDYVLPMFDTVIESAIAQGTNSKSQLQEWAQQACGELPTYAVVSATGPDHSKRFTVEVAVAGQVIGQGEGTTKKQAEKAAAAAALQQIASGKPICS